VRKLATILLVVSIIVLIASIPFFGVSAAGAACVGAPTPRLTSGIQARPAQIYSTLWASPDSTAIITVMYRASGDTFNVQSGVICAFGPYNWYQVNFKGVVGWVTEGTGSTYWVEPTGGVSPTAAPGTPGTPLPPTPTKPPATPATPAPNTGACAGAPAPRLKIGGNGRPTQVFSSLRSAVDSNNVITVMYAARGDVFKVTAGPFCGYGLYNWWQVNFKGTLGYVTEGSGNTYWVEPAP
jgi:hypothetical protein